MKSVWRSLLGTVLRLCIFLDIIFAQQSCPPPDVPRDGGYSPKWNKFQPGDRVTYKCKEGYTLMGRETSKCKSNGEWTNPMPFCDMKARTKSLFAMTIKGDQLTNILVADNNTDTCFSLYNGEFIVMTLDKPGSAYAVRMFLKGSSINIDITNGLSTCSQFGKPIIPNQWILIPCNKDEAISNIIRIQDKSRKNYNSTICEVEVYVKEEEGCENPPDRKVANGYFEVTRSTAKLICEDGYQSDRSSGRLVCERNSWVGSRLQCNEILCDPVVSAASGGEWMFLDPVRKISAGTRRRLSCSDKHSMAGGPEIIVCQKDGFWTETNATCVDVSKAKASTRLIAFCTSGVIVAVIIISLLVTTIYFVKKQRREVVVVYKQPTEGSVISGSEAEYASASVYYESIHSSALQPQPPTSQRPLAQLISDEYFSPLDRKNSLRKHPMPSDIAFGTLKPSTQYSNC